MIINCYFYVFILEEEKLANFTILQNGEMVKLTKEILIKYEEKSNDPLEDNSIAQQILCLFGFYLNKTKCSNLICKFQKDLKKIM